MMDGDGHAARRQRAGHRPAQPPAGAGDQRDPAAQLHQRRRGAIGRISPVGAPGPATASAMHAARQIVQLDVRRALARGGDVVAGAHHAGRDGVDAGSAGRAARGPGSG